jgi:hypothetical protein
MGVVDLAVGPEGRPVALKRLALHGSAAELAAARARVRREAEVLARLDHPAIVRLLDVLDDGDDVVLVMAHLGGGSLADRVRESGPLAPGEVRAIADALLPALAAAHRAGVVHRDIKPANVLFDDAGRAHLSDFGVARLAGATAGLTHTGAVVGTPAYMAPEQARGDEAGPPADVFALGATLAFALTGASPWGDGDARVVLRRVAEGRPDRVHRDVAGPLDGTLAAMLALRPERRPSAAELAGGPTGTAVLDRAGDRGRRRSWLAPVLAVAGSAAAVLVVALVLIGVRDRSGSPAGADAPEGAAPCVDLPYQRCGEAPAPNTDGRRCLDDRADYDGDRDNGCEAVPDDRDGEVLADERVLAANLVPTDDIDRYPFEVADRLHLSCDGTVTVSLTAPEGVAMRLDVLEDDRILGTATSRDAEPAEVTLLESSCGGDDSASLVARVSWVGDERSAEPYRLERRGNF